MNGNPEERLGGKNGALEVMTHAFFEDVDWDLTATKGVTPPIKPKQDVIAQDVSNFASFYTRQRPIESIVNTSLTKSQKVNFRNFEYNRTASLRPGSTQPETSLLLTESSESKERTASSNASKLTPKSSMQDRVRNF